MSQVTLMVDAIGEVGGYNLQQRSCSVAVELQNWSRSRVCHLQNPAQRPRERLMKNYRVTVSQTKTRENSYVHQTCLLSLH